MRQHEDCSSPVVGGLDLGPGRNKWGASVPEVLRKFPLKVRYLRDRESIGEGT